MSGIAPSTAAGSRRSERVPACATISRIRAGTAIPPQSVCMAIARASLSISSAMLSPSVAMELSRSLLGSAVLRGRQRRRGQREGLYFVREGVLARLIQERGQRHRAIAGDEPALEGGRA